MKSGPFDFSGSTGDRPRTENRAHFEDFEAMELYCPRCKRAVPVRKFLLLVLPEGDKYEYRCQYCGQSVGDKIDRSAPFPGILRT
jgi:hypothetical protein